MLLARAPRSGATRPGIMCVRPCRSLTPEAAMSAAPTAEMLYGISDSETLRRVAVTTISSISSALAGAAVTWAPAARIAAIAADRRGTRHLAAGSAGFEGSFIGHPLRVDSGARAQSRVTRL